MAVYLHQLTHAAMTGIGTRPRPIQGKPELSEAVPLYVALWRPGENPRLTEPYAKIPVIDYCIYPALKTPDGNAKPAHVILAVIVDPQALEGGRAASLAKGDRGLPNREEGKKT